VSPRAYTLNLKREVRKLVTMLRQHDKLADAMMREQIAEQIRAARPPWVSYRSFADMVTQAGYPLTLGQLNKWRDPSHSMRVGGWGGKRQRRVPTAADEAAAALAAQRLLHHSMEAESNRRIAAALCEINPRFVAMRPSWPPRSDALRYMPRQFMEELELDGPWWRSGSRDRIIDDLEEGGLL
jgi:hypothetical protein